MNLFTLILRQGNRDQTISRKLLCDDGAAFFGACTITQGTDEWEGIAEPVAILIAYTAKGRIACESS